MPTMFTDFFKIIRENTPDQIALIKCMTSSQNYLTGKLIH